MHCMSREYLAEELMYEKDSKVQKKDHFADSEQWVPECKGKKYDDKIKQTFDNVKNTFSKVRILSLDVN